MITCLTNFVDIFFWQPFCLLRLKRWVEKLRPWCSYQKPWIHVKQSIIHAFIWIVMYNLPNCRYLQKIYSTRPHTTFYRILSQNRCCNFRVSWCWKNDKYKVRKNVIKLRHFHGNIVSIIIDTQSSENKWESNFTRGGKGIWRYTLFWNRNLLKKIYKVSLLYSIPSNVVVQIHKESDSRNLVPSCSRAGTLDLKAKISPTSQIFPPTSKFSPNIPTSKL